jgi:hypothetical protein
MSVPIMFGMTALGIITGRLVPVPRRAALYLLMVAVLVGEQAFIADTFSLPSIAFLVVLYFPWAFRIAGTVEDPHAHLSRFLDLALLLAMLGVVQYCLQFVVGVKYAFPIEHLMPQSIITHDYNTLNHLRYGSSVVKANGVFLVEPATLSQIIAIAFSLEAGTRLRPWRLAGYGAGLVVAYSGTGLMVMALTVPTLIVIYKRFDLLIFLVAVAVLLLLFADQLGLGLFVKRAGEFQDPGSSGFARFVGGFYFFQQYLWPDPQSWAFGLGSGALHESGAGLAHQVLPFPIYPVASSGWVKVIAEFGLVGASIYFIFFYYSVFSAEQPFILRLALAAMPALCGMLDAWAHGLILTLLLWPPVGREKSIAIREAPLPSGPAAPWRSSAAL